MTSHVEHLIKTRGEQATVNGETIYIIAQPIPAAFGDTLMGTVEAQRLRIFATDELSRGATMTFRGSTWMVEHDPEEHYDLGELHHLEATIVKLEAVP